MGKQKLVLFLDVEVADDDYQLREKLITEEINKHIVDGEFVYPKELGWEAKDYHTDYNLDNWELANKLETISKFLKGQGMSIFNNADKESKMALEGFEGTLKQVEGYSVEFNRQMSESEGRIYDEWDKTDKNLRDKYHSITRKLREDLVLPEIKVPYGLKEVIKLAMDVEHVPERAWGKILELAKELKTKDTKE